MCGIRSDFAEFCSRNSEVHERDHVRHPSRLSAQSLVKVVVIAFQGAIELRQTSNGGCRINYCVCASQHLPTQIRRVQSIARRSVLKGIEKLRDSLGVFQ